MGMCIEQRRRDLWVKLMDDKRTFSSSLGFLHGDYVGRRDAFDSYFKNHYEQRTIAYGLYDAAAMALAEYVDVYALDVQGVRYMTPFDVFSFMSIGMYIPHTMSYSKGYGIHFDTCFDIYLQFGIDLDTYSQNGYVLDFNVYTLCRDGVFSLFEKERDNWLSTYTELSRQDVDSMRNHMYAIYRAYAHVYAHDNKADNVLYFEPNGYVLDAYARFASTVLHTDDLAKLDRWLHVCCTTFCVDN